MKENSVLSALILVMMSIAGTLARILNSKNYAPNFLQILGELFISGFMGVILFWITSALDVDQRWMFAAAGIAGWIGPQLLDWISELIKGVAAKKTGVKLDDSTNVDKQDDIG